MTAFIGAALVLSATFLIGFKTGHHFGYWKCLDNDIASLNAHIINRKGKGR